MSASIHRSIARVAARNAFRAGQTGDMQLLDEARVTDRFACSDAEMPRCRDARSFARRAGARSRAEQRGPRKRCSPPLQRTLRPQMPIAKRPCSDCPFRCDGAGIPLQSGRVEGIVSDLLADDLRTFVCHKTLDGVQKRMSCAGAMGLMLKMGRLPVIARVGLVCGVISMADLEASAGMVIDPRDLALSVPSSRKSHAGVVDDVWNVSCPGTGEEGAS